MEPWPVAHVIPIAMSLPPGDLRIASYVSCMEMPRYGVTCSVNHLANVNDANSRPAWHDALAPAPSAWSESPRCPRSSPAAPTSGVRAHGGLAGRRQRVVW